MGGCFFVLILFTLEVSSKTTSPATIIRSRLYMFIRSTQQRICAKPLLHSPRIRCPSRAGPAQMQQICLTMMQAPMPVFMEAIVASGRAHKVCSNIYFVKHFSYFSHTFHILEVMSITIRRPFQCQNICPANCEAKVCISFPG